MNQTLELTTLGALEPGDGVNLEPALRAGDRLGGHIVQGHVDGAAEVARGHARTASPAGSGVALPDGARALRRRARLDRPRRRQPHRRAASTPARVEVSLIPETLERTTLGEARAAGDRVNVEVDVIARYAERLLQSFQTKHQMLT